MDFKPTLWKTITTILVFLLINILGALFIRGADSFLVSIIYSIVTFYFIWIPITLLVYIIWSLFQNKRQF